MTNILRRKNRFYPILSFVFKKVFASITNWVIEILMLVTFIVVFIVIFSNGYNEGEIFQIMQYPILIYFNIYLFLFIVLNSIKVISDAVEDGTMILLISNPYSRWKIFFSKVSSLALAVIIFILVNLSALMLISYLLGYIKPDVRMSVVMILVRLILFSLFFTFVALSGVVFLSFVFKSQVVFLIAVIFSSLFLLGGLPYSLLREINNGLIMHLYKEKPLGPIQDKDKIKEAQKPSLKKLKEVILFDKFLYQGNIKHPNITKKLYEAYYVAPNNSLTPQQRLEFFNELDLYKSVTMPQLTLHSGDNPERWREEDTLNLELEFNFSFNKYFKSLDELDMNNVYHKEIYEMASQYFWKGIPEIRPSERRFQSDKCCDLIEIDEENFNITVPGIMDEDTVIEGNDALSKAQEYLKNANKFQFASPEERLQFEDLLYSRVHALIREFEDNIKSKATDYHTYTTYYVDQNSQDWIKYSHSVDLYKVLSSVNVFEHWNQLWTTIMGDPSYWFMKRANSVINFDEFKNYLNSYKDFPISLDEDGRIKVEDLDYFLNIYKIIGAYSALAVAFLIGAGFIMVKRDFT